MENTITMETKETVEKEICPRCKKETKLFNNYKSTPLCKDCLKTSLDISKEIINLGRGK